MIHAGLRQVVAMGALISLSTVARAQVCEGARPTDPGGSQGLGYGAAEVSYYDSASGRARVHYALTGAHAPPAASTLEDGVPDAVVVAAQAADAAFVKFDELGYVPPLSDAASPCASNGGSDAVDVYLLNFAAADGQAVLDHCQAETPKRCAGFMLVENDFKRGGYADATEGLRTVVPHELFHLVQDAYDTDVERWWAEGSAQWAAKQVYPELRDLERFLPAYFDNPWRPLDVPPNGPITDFLYATAIWPVFLSERFDADIVRKVHEQFSSTQGGVFDATDAVLQNQYETSLADEFLEFAVYNAATAERAPEQGGYANAIDYPAVELTPFTATPGTELSEVTAGLGAFYYSVTATKPSLLWLDQGTSQRLSAALLPVESGKVRLDRARELPPSFEGDAIIVVTGRTLERTDAPFTLRASEPQPTDMPPLSDSDEPDASGCSLTHQKAGSNLDHTLTIAAMLAFVTRLRRRGSRKDA